MDNESDNNFAFRQSTICVEREMVISAEVLGKNTMQFQLIQHHSTCFLSFYSATNFFFIERNLYDSTLNGMKLNENGQIQKQLESENFSRGKKRLNQVLRASVVR